MKQVWIWAALLTVGLLTLGCGGGVKKEDFDELKEEVARMKKDMGTFESNIDADLDSKSKRINTKLEGMEDNLLPDLKDKLAAIAKQLNQVVAPAMVKMILESEKLVKDLSTYQTDTTAKVDKIEKRAIEGNAKLIGSLEEQEKQIDAHVKKIAALIQALNK